MKRPHRGGITSTVRYVSTVKHHHSHRMIHHTSAMTTPWHHHHFKHVIWVCVVDGMLVCCVVWMWILILVVILLKIVDAVGARILLEGMLWDRSLLTQLRLECAIRVHSILLSKFFFLVFNPLTLFKELLNYMLSSATRTNRIASSGTPSLLVNLLWETTLASLSLGFEIIWRRSFLCKLFYLHLLLFEEIVSSLNNTSSCPAILCLLRDSSGWNALIDIRFESVSLFFINFFSKSFLLLILSLCILVQFINSVCL